MKQKENGMIPLKELQRMDNDSYTFKHEFTFKKGLSRVSQVIVFVIETEELNEPVEINIIEIEERIVIRERSSVTASHRNLFRGIIINRLFDKLEEIIKNDKRMRIKLLTGDFKIERESLTKDAQTYNTFNFLNFVKTLSGHLFLKNFNINAILFILMVVIGISPIGEYRLLLLMVALGLQLSHLFYCFNKLSKRFNFYRLLHNQKTN